MRYIIYGAGAIGGVVGAKLHLAGKDTVLIARGEHLRALQSRGMELRTPDETMMVPVRAVAHPEEIDWRPDDVVLLTMKSQDTQAALEELRLAAGDQVPVVCCQNGVANEDMALRRFANVYGVVVFMPANYLEAGVVEAGAWPKAGVLDIGRYPSGVDATCEAIARDLEESDLLCEPMDNIMAFKYTKLLSNMVNAAHAVCGNEADTRDLISLMRAETEACYAAAGIEMMPNEALVARMRQVSRNGGPRPNTSSTWQSLARGAGSSEVDYLNGEIARLGRLHNVPTPANEAFQLAAERLARRKLPPGSISVEEMKAEIERRSRAVSAVK